MEHGCHAIDNAHLMRRGAFDRRHVVLFVLWPSNGEFCVIAAAEAAAAAAPICPPIIAGVKTYRRPGDLTKSEHFLRKFLWDFFREGARYR